MRSNSRFLHNLKRFKLISFDVTDTIIKPKSQSAQYAKSAQRYGIDIKPEILRDEIKLHFHDMLKTYPNFGRCSPCMNWEKWWKELVKRVFLKMDPTIPETKLDSLAQELINVFATAECWALVDNIVELLDRLSQANKCMGVISNTDPRLELILKELNLLDYFNFITISYVVGIEKPNKRIFEETLEKFDVEPCEALHIGNTYATDYFGAKNAGWSSILVTGKVLPPELGINENHKFNNMRDLIDTLDNKVIEW